MNGKRTSRGVTVRRLVSLVCGTSVALSLFAHVSHTSTAACVEIPALAGLACLLAGLAHLLLFHTLIPRLAKPPRSVAPLCVLASLAIGTLLAASVPIDRRVHASIKVVATGRKNPAAHASEVWLRGVYRHNGSKVPVEEFQLDGNWEIRDNVPLSYQVQPATLCWNGQVTTATEFSFKGNWTIGDVAAPPPASAPAQPRLEERLTTELRLRFLAHPWSGIVEVSSGQYSTTVDLYAPSHVARYVTVPVLGQPVGAGWLAASRTRVPDSVSLGFLVFIACGVLVPPLRRLRLADLRRPTAIRAVVCAGLSILATASLWNRGLANYPCRQGTLTVEAAATGTDVLPIQLDRAGREVVDLPLDRYEHTGRCRLVTGATAAGAVAFLGIIDDTSDFHPPTFAELEGTGELVEIPDCQRQGIWMGPDELRAFKFRLEYEEASAVFFVPGPAASIELSVDGCTKMVELVPGDDDQALIHVSLRSWQRPAGLIRYEVHLPAVYVSCLRFGPLPDGATARIGSALLDMPGLRRIDNRVRDQRQATALDHATLPLAGSLRYEPGIVVLRAGIFVLTAGALFLILCGLYRICGTANPASLQRTPVAGWEWAALAVCLVLNLWLQTAACGWYSGDSRAYVSQAISRARTGTTDPLLDTHPPAYSLFLTAVFWLGGAGPSAWAATSAFSLAGIAGGWWLGRLMGGRPGGCLVAAYLATNPTLLLVSRVVLPDLLFCVAVIAWFYIALRWCVSGARSSWLWALATGFAWIVPVLIRPNALSLLGLGLVVPWLRSGSVPRRILLAVVFMVAGLSVYLLSRGGAASTRMLAWGRMWPILSHRFVAQDSREFRPLRTDYLVSKARLVGYRPRIFYDRIYTDQRRAATEEAVRATVDASVRRAPHRVQDALLTALKYAYIRPARGHLFGLPLRVYPTKETYQRIFQEHLNSGERFHPATDAYLATFRTLHREGTLCWAVFRWIHHHLNVWRLWPMTLLAIVGLIYVLIRREGALALPAAVNLAIVMPLCLLFTYYDRYFLPGEILLALQAAVGLRAIMVWSGRSEARPTRSLHAGHTAEGSATQNGAGTQVGA